MYAKDFSSAGFFFFLTIEKKSKKQKQDLSKMQWNLFFLEAT